MPDLVGAATDFERDPARQSGRDDAVGDAFRPLPGAPPGRQKIVVLEKEYSGTLFDMELAHFLDHRRGRAQAPQLAALGLIERADAAEIAVPRAAAAAEDRGGGKVPPAIVDVGTFRKREPVEIVDSRPQRIGDDLLAPPIGDAGDAAPVLAPAEFVHQLDEGRFTLKAND